MSFAGYSFCKGHSCSYIQVAQHSCALRAHHPAEFMAAVLSNGGGYYQPFAYVAEAMRMGLTILPPDINASEFRCTGKGREIRIGSAICEGTLGRRGGADTRSSAEAALPASSIFAPGPESRPGDLRLLIKVGALDSIAQGWTRPMMLWMVDWQRDSGAAGTARRNEGVCPRISRLLPPRCPPPPASPTGSMIYRPLCPCSRSTLPTGGGARNTTSSASSPTLIRCSCTPISCGSIGSAAAPSCTGMWGSTC